MLMLSIYLPVVSGCARTGIPESAAELVAWSIAVPAGRYHVGSHQQGCYPPAVAEVSAYYLWPREVTRKWWRLFRPDDPAGEGDANMPVTASYHDARAFCTWLEQRYQVRARLPTPEEWMVAASAGTAGVKYPWGWGHPEGRAAFDAISSSSVASFPPGPNGLYDMSGNVAEWASAPTGEDRAPVMGGSWAERDPDYLRIAHRLSLPVDYRGADVGFRVLIEASQMSP